MASSSEFATKSSLKQASVQCLAIDEYPMVDNKQDSDRPLAPVNLSVPVHPYSIESTRECFDASYMEYRYPSRVFSFY